jgi:amino acid permease
MTAWFEKNKPGVMKLLGFVLVGIPALGFLYLVLAQSGVSEVAVPIYWLFLPFMLATLYGYHIARRAEMLEVERLIEKKLQEALRQKDSISPPPNGMVKQEAAPEEAVRH